MIITWPFFAETFVCEICSPYPEIKRSRITFDFCLITYSGHVQERRPCRANGRTCKYVYYNENLFKNEYIIFKVLLLWLTLLCDETNLGICFYKSWFPISDFVQNVSVIARCTDHGAPVVMSQRQNILYSIIALAQRLARVFCIISRR